MEPKMNEEELKRKAKKRRRAVPEATWAYLKKLGFVDEALELFDEQSVEYIIEEIDALDAASPGGGARRTQAVRSNGSPEETVQVSLGESELARQGALEEYFAMCAACDRDVYP